MRYLAALLTFLFVSPALAQFNSLSGFGSESPEVPPGTTFDNDAFSSLGGTFDPDPDIPLGTTFDNDTFSDLGGTFDAAPEIPPGTTFDNDLTDLMIVGEPTEPIGPPETVIVEFPEGDSEYVLIHHANASSVYHTFLDFMVNIRGPVDPSGAIAGNRGGWQHAAEQRKALWRCRRGILTNDEAQVDDCVRAMEYAFQHQHEDGYFLNGLGASPTQAINADTFFMAGFARAYLMVGNSQFADDYLPRLQALLPGADDNVAWLMENTAAMIGHDQHVANRLLYDAAALYLNGLILEDPTYQQEGLNFLYMALDMQDPAGWLAEKGGYDSGYQGVSMTLLEVIWASMPSSQAKSDVWAAILAGMEWEKTRVHSNGCVDGTGNTRTGYQGSEGKELNYEKIILSFYYAGHVLNTVQGIQIGDAVAAYGMVGPRNGVCP